MSASARPITIAVVGNPNTGKSTLFNALTGLHQKVANFPGVTVEHKLGTLDLDGLRARIIDLPGTYSIAAQAPDEEITVDVLLGAVADLRVDVLLIVADASSLYRNLYLASQLLEARLPTVLALNMEDVARARGLRIDLAKLEERLGIPVVATNGRTRRGLAELRRTLRWACDGKTSLPRLRLFAEWDDALRDLGPKLDAHGARPRPIELLRALIDEGGPVDRRLAARLGPPYTGAMTELRARCAREGELIETEARRRYAWIQEVCAAALCEPSQRPPTPSERIDRLLTHRLWGTAILVLVLALLFQAIFTGAQPLMDALAAAVSAVGDAASTRIGDDLARSLVVDGVISGVGAVVVFVPQIALLFLLMAFLEDCGYLARAAFIMDRVFAGLGLSGKSLIPLVSSFACAVPGIMAARTIEQRRDRLATILVAPLMSCSARLPVYALLIAAFVPSKTWLGVIGLQGLTLLGLYALGPLIALPVLFLLRRTVLQGERPPFLMELPSYQWPVARTVGLRVWNSVLAFLKRAGTVIFALSLIIWSLAYFPHPPELATHYPDEGQRAGAYLRQSWLGRMGQALEPAVRPLGWDWKIGMSVIASFPAREVIIATLGTVYNLGQGQDETSTALHQALRAERHPDGRAVFTLPVALSILVFFALCSQCMATLATIRQEAGGWRWATFAFVYMTALAYGGAWVAYQGAGLLGWA